jgi:hypothetical protein
MDLAEQIINLYLLVEYTGFALDQSDLLIEIRFIT